MNETAESLSNKPGVEEPTVAALLSDVRGRLRSAGIPNSGLDARLLVGAALRMEIEKLILYSDQRVDGESVHRVQALVNERVRRVPVSRILGKRDFWDREYKLSAATLDPRPDSETLVGAALEQCRQSGRGTIRILDLGVGSGCLLITLLCELPGSVGVGVDLDPGAIATARLNAETHGVGDRAMFLCGNWTDALWGKFDLIISNPPYICSDVIATLEPEVALYDPLLALDGGRDGLIAYRKIIASAHPLVSENGCVLLELGNGQLAAVSSILCDAGFAVKSVNQDLSGISRCVCATPVAN